MATGEPSAVTSDAGDPAARFYARHRDRTASAVEAAAAGLSTALASGSHRYSAVYEALKATPADDALELGYGGGAIVAALAPLAARYAIVDVVERTGSGTLPANVSAHLANLDNRFPFADARFDTIVAMMVIEHLYDPFHAFAEIARVARPGARIFVNLPNIAALKCRLQLLVGRMPVTSSPDWFANREWDGNHLHYFTVADVRRIAGLYGLRVTAVRPVGRLTALKRLRPALLCHEITYVLEKPGAQSG